MIEFEKPNIECLEADDKRNYAKFICEPLERGYGMTIGNSLRRILLSSLPGTAITSVKIDGVVHEFSTIPGVVEDVVEIILNLKQVRLKIFDNEEKSLRIDFNLAGTTGTVGTQISTGSNLPISGTPTAIGMWVYATTSSKGAWIRLQYSQTGSSGALYADFGTIDWEGWKYLEAPIDNSVTYPISIKYLIFFNKFSTLK